MTGPADKNDQPQSESTVDLPGRRKKSRDGAAPADPAPEDAQAVTSEPASAPAGAGGDDAPAVTPEEASSSPQPDFTAPVADQSPTFGAPVPAPSATGTAETAGQDAYTATKIRWINPRRRTATWLIAAAAAVVLAGAGFGAGWAWAITVAGISN